MAASHTISLAVLLAAFTADALAQGKAASAPSTPAAPSPKPAQRDLLPQPATPAAPSAQPANPRATSPMVTPGGQQPPHAGPGNTPGLATMTPQEQQQLQRDLQRAKTGDECRAVVAMQREQAAQRARERGQPMPNNVGPDPCVGR